MGSIIIASCNSFLVGLSNSFSINSNITGVTSSEKVCPFSIFLSITLLNLIEYGASTYYNWVETLTSFAKFKKGSLFFTFVKPRSRITFPSHAEIYFAVVHIRFSHLSTRSIIHFKSIGFGMSAPYNSHIHSSIDK